MTDTEETRTVSLYTLGCKVSQYETEAIAEGFEAAGFLRVPFGTAATVTVINTCTVTAESDRKCRQIIRRAIKDSPRGLVMVCGCYAQTTPEDIAAIDGVAYVSGTNGKTRLPALALAMLEEGQAAPIIDVAKLEGAAFEPMCISHAPRTRAYVKIEDGCECRCTYCAIPLARGSVRSKPMADVIAEVMTLAKTSREVVLTGIETASWGRDIGDERLIDLLEAIDREEGAPRIRLGSLSPELITPDFAARYGRLRCVAPHLHLSMQSGSDAVLRGMRRRYNTKMALAALDALRREVRGIQFTTDLMVGFPGEGDAEFEETLDFCRRARFLDVHVFAYSRRPGTPAAAFDGQVEESVKHTRSAALISLKNEIRDEILSEIVASGEPISVLFETEEGGLLHGHSDSFLAVCMPAASRGLCGEIVSVRPVRAEGGILWAELI